MGQWSNARVQKLVNNCKREVETNLPYCFLCSSVKLLSIFGSLNQCSHFSSKDSVMHLSMKSHNLVDEEVDGV